MYKSSVLLVLFFVGSLQAASKLPPKATCRDLLASEGLTRLVLDNVARFPEYPGYEAHFMHQMMIELIGHFDHPVVDFAFFEQLFRKQGFPVYLVANANPPDPQYTIGFPKPLEKIKVGKTAKYWLWVCVYGEEEATQMKAGFGVTDGENIKRLEETGLLMVKSAAELDPSKVTIPDAETAERLRKGAEPRSPSNPDTH